MGYMGYPIYGVSLDMGYTAVARIAHMGYPSYCRTSTDSHQPMMAGDYLYSTSGDSCFIYSSILVL